MELQCVYTITRHPIPWQAIFYIQNFTVSVKTISPDMVRFASPLVELPRPFPAKAPAWQRKTCMTVAGPFGLLGAPHHFVEQKASLSGSPRVVRCPSHRRKQAPRGRGAFQVSHGYPPSILCTEIKVSVRTESAPPASDFSPCERSSRSMPRLSGGFPPGRARGFARGKNLR